MISIDTRKAIFAAPAILLMVLTVLSFAYGLNPISTIRHAGWYAFNDVDSIPVWVLPAPVPLVDIYGDPVETSPPGRADRVESWGVSSAEMTRVMQEHELLTDWWREEIRLAIDARLPRDNPLVSSYVGTVFEIGSEFRKQVPEDILLSKVTEENRMPGPLQAGGCRPRSSAMTSADPLMIYYNTGTRQLCDNLIGGTQWLLAFSLIGLGVAARRSRES